jgi:hypothetical protein
MSGINKVARLDDQPGSGVGRSWRETRQMFGKEAIEDTEVTSVVPGVSYTVPAEPHCAG